MMVVRNLIQRHHLDSKMEAEAGATIDMLYIVSYWVYSSG